MVISTLKAATRKRTCKVRSNSHTGQYADSISPDHSQGQTLVEPLALPAVSFNTTVRQMTKMFQWQKCLSKKWPKCLNDKKKIWTFNIHHSQMQSVTAVYSSDTLGPHLELQKSTFLQNLLKQSLCLLEGCFFLNLRYWLDLTFRNIRSSEMINFGSSQFSKLIYRKCVFSLVLSVDPHCLNTSSSWKLPFVPSCKLKHFFHDTLNSDAPCNFYLTNHKNNKLHSKS